MLYLLSVILRSQRRRQDLIAVFLLCVLPVQAQEISIGLYDDIKTLYLTANQDYRVVETGPRTILKKGKGARSLIRSSPAAANSLLIAAEPDLVTTSRHVEFICEQECIFKIKHGNTTRDYRGSIVIKPDEDHFTVINKLDLEDYLKGVVPAEMPSSWHQEALKAQAVAARTYSLSMLGRREALGYDLKSGVEDQVYLGYKKEQPSTNAAIEATDGQVMIDNQGLLVDAYFSSSGGTYTASPDEGWGISPKSYLVTRKEPIKLAKWQVDLSKRDLNNKLADLKLKSIEAVTLINQSMEGRATAVLLSDRNSHVLLTGEEFRHQLGLRSTNFRIKMRPNGIRINGYGFGHGSGMSQYGAKYLAEHGKNYQQILGHYYYKAKLVN